MQVNNLGQRELPVSIDISVPMELNQVAVWKDIEVLNPQVLRRLYGRSVNALSLDSLWLFCCCSLTAHLCPTLCDPIDCSPPGSPVRGIFQARILKWVAISSCRRSSLPRDQTHVSCIGRRIFTASATWEAYFVCVYLYIFNTDTF